MPIDQREFEAARGIIAETGVFGTYDFAAGARFLDPLPTKRFESVWRRADGVFEFQVYYFDRAMNYPWNYVPFATELYKKLLDVFRLELYPERLLVEFIPEVNGWYVKATIPEQRTVDNVLLAATVDSVRCDRAF